MTLRTAADSCRPVETQSEQDVQDRQSPESNMTAIFQAPATLNSTTHDTPPTNNHKAQSPISIRVLPNELLCHIFEYLDDLPPSASALHDEPHFGLTRSGDTPLKAASLVSKRWREASKPVLFRDTQFTVETAPRRDFLSNQIKPFLDFIASNSLQKIVRSLILLVLDNKVTNMTKGANGRRQLNEFDSFWVSLFEIVDPVGLLIVAAPEALGPLTSCHVYLEDAWNFDCPCHYLLLERPKNVLALLQESPFANPIIFGSYQPNGSSSSAAGPQPLAQFVEEDGIHRASSSALFDIRPWSKLLLNEGSFIRAYATYEFWLRIAPSILPDLVGAETPNHKAYISPTIREMSYIGMFPMMRHFCALTENLPRLDRLYVQLVPRNDILQNASKMAQVESEDLWMERNASYASLMRELFNTPPSQNYEHLRVFESGDAADRDAWQLAVEYVKRAGKDWRVGGDGVLVRDSKDTEAAKCGDDDEEPSTFSGSLVRWAWNGTAELPVSAYPLYDHPMGP